MGRFITAGSLVFAAAIATAVVLTGCGKPTQGSGPPGGGKPEVGVAVYYRSQKGERRLLPRQTL